MNEFEQVTDSQIDRLVDGEMTLVEKRGVLLSLEMELEGWKRLATAFLESQAWQETLPRATNHPDHATIALREKSPRLTEKSSPVQRRRKIMTALTLGLCGLLSFELGRFIEQTRPVGHSQPVLHQANSFSWQTPVPGMGAPAEKTAVSTSVASIATYQTLRLELGDEKGQSQAVEVPVVDGANLEFEELWNPPPVITEELQRTLLKSGRRAREQRRFLEVTLDDGRSGLVPVSDVQFEIAGPDAYQ